MTLSVNHLAGEPDRQPGGLDDQALSERFQPLFQRIAEGAIAREESRQLPYQEVAWLKEAGFGALRVPRRYGGSGVSLPQLFRLISRLGQADSNLPQIFRAHFGFVEDRLNQLDEASDAYWFPRIVAGEIFGAAMAEQGDSTGNTVEVVRQQAHWLINGEKYYSTGTLFAEWISLAAKEGEDFLHVAVPSDAPGVTRVDDWNGFGQRLTGSGTTRFAQVRVDDPRHILRRVGLASGEWFKNSYLSAFYQEVHLANLAGIARAILQAGIDFVQGRTRTFGVPGKSYPRENPLVQRVIGRLSALAFAAESLVEHSANALERVWQARQAGTLNKELFSEADIRVYQAQQILLPQALEAASLLFEVGGASAANAERRLDRYWRNARTLASHNPAILREAALGDYYLNGVSPSDAWEARIQAAAEAARAQRAGDEKTDDPGAQKNAEAGEGRA